MYFNAVNRVVATKADNHTALKLIAQRQYQTSTIPIIINIIVIISPIII